MKIDYGAISLVGNLIIGALLLVLAFRKAPKDMANIDATTIQQYAQTVKTMGEENARLQKQIDDNAESSQKKINELEARLKLVEDGRYRLVAQFLVGAKPEVELVTIEPVVEPA